MKLSIQELDFLVDTLTKLLLREEQELYLTKGFTPKSSRIKIYESNIKMLGKIKNKLSIELTYKQHE